MQVLWCWRCRADVVMLNEEEFAPITELYRHALTEVKEFREQSGIGLSRDLLDVFFTPVRVHYEVLTGVQEKNHVAILHHRTSLYGPPCKRCRKPLRTPQAKLCGSCMTPVDPS